MGHRALVAYRRADGRHDLYYSHWGAADLALAGRLAGDPVADPVDPEPLAVGLTFEAVVADHVDVVHHEALYVVDGGVRAYRPLWFGLGDDDGALVGVDPRDPRDDAFLRGWFRGTRAVVADAVACGAVDGEAAIAYLRRRLREWAGDGREVIPVSG